MSYNDQSYAEYRLEEAEEALKEAFGEFKNDPNHRFATSNLQAAMTEYQSAMSVVKERDAYLRMIEAENAPILRAIFGE